MRVVVDSNVWISALVFGGRPRDVFALIMGRGHSLVVSEEILTEVRRILHSRFPDFMVDFEALLAVLVSRSERVMLGSEKIHVCRDPDDNRVLETAVVGNATHVISGDKDLLVLGRYAGVAIVSPSEALTVGLQQTP